MHRVRRFRVGRLRFWYVALPSVLALIKLYDADPEAARYLYWRSLRWSRTQSRCQ